MKFLEIKVLSFVLFTLFGSTLAQKQDSVNTDLNPTNTSNSSNISPNTTPPSMYRMISTQ
jgi:hypothetical protein